MNKWILPLFLILSMLLPVTAHAQDPLSLSSMLIEIWPEYDKPDVLVIYQMTLSSSTTFPATVSVRIPTAAGDPNAVAEIQANGKYNLNYTRQVNGDWSTITFTTTSQAVQVEYYDPGLKKDGAARSFQYVWPGDYAINQLTIDVQQPVGAANMRISPSLGAGTTGSDNLTYYIQDIGAISAGQPIRITIEYQKSSDALSVGSLTVEPSAPIPQGTTSDSNPSNWLQWVLILLGAGLIIGGSIWFWQSGRQRPALQAHRRRASKAQAKINSFAAGSMEDAVYCSQCGKRALPGDQFCRSCGTPIRNQ